MERKLKITEGEWIIDDNTITDKNGFSIAEPCEFAIYMNWSEKGLYHWSEEGGSFERSKEELEANAQLITEAGTVANECDLMPRELLNQRNELREALKNFMDFPIEDLEGWANDKSPVTITVQPRDIKQALEALEKTK